MNKKMTVNRSTRKAVYTPVKNRVIAYAVNGEEQVGRVVIERAANYSKPEFLEDENFWKKKIQRLKMVSAK
ncbi:hypothetical protein ACFFIY_03100 [Bhargavaea ullalensis]|uniref:Phage protein n=1 Tax=Bhargavaea ullalensis TaxID=1265685 RepID=A0ABV2GCV0_9BACL